MLKQCCLLNPWPVQPRITSYNVCYTKLLRPDHAGPGVGSGCGSDNTATTSPATAAGDALNLVVQYVRNGTTESAANPVSIQVEQQVNGGNWSPLALTDLDPGLDLQSTVATSDT